MAGKRFYSESIADKLVETIVEKIEPGEQVALSKREQDIFCLLGEGYSIREIADKLSLSHKTVETHCGNLKLKLGVKTMRELSRKAIRQSNKTHR